MYSFHLVAPHPRTTQQGSSRHQGTRQSKLGTMVTSDMSQVAVLKFLTG